MKVSASIYSNNQKQLADLIDELDAHRIDYFHVDCNNDPKVFDDIRFIRTISKTPVDLHIISSTPEKYFDAIIENNVEFVSFQYENLTKKLTLPANWQSKTGLAITSSTAVDVFKQYEHFDFVLMMTTTPGQSGGRFRHENFKKIREFKSKFPSKKIQVDGGVNEEVSFILRNMAVDSIVSGSYLLNHDYIGAQLMSLKSNAVDSHYQVKDFKIDLEESPVITNQNPSFIEILQSIEDGNMGFTILTDNEKKLKGIISNADVRRGLLKNKSDLRSVSVDSMINRNPVLINENATVTEMLSLIKSHNFAILFLPVVDDHQCVTGSMMFNNLIKGES